MKKFICIKDRVFFNKKIYNYGDMINVEDELAEKLSKGLFKDYEEYVKEQEEELKEIKAAQGQGKTVESLVKEHNAEKAEMKKKHKAEIEKIKAEYEAKIEKLEKQLNPVKKIGA